MKYLQYVLVVAITSSLNGMKRWPERSVEGGTPLIDYWSVCQGISLEKVRPEAVRLYDYLKKIAQDSPTLLNLTPRQLAETRLEELYFVLYEKKLESEVKTVRLRKKFLIKESGNTVEALLNYLISLKKLS
jgi:hypothetical protein